MKYVGLPKGMWLLFSKSFERNLIAEMGMGKEEAGRIRKRTKGKYKEIIANLPEFEKGDRFAMNIVNCALLSAFVLHMQKRPDADSLTDYYAK